MDKQKGSIATVGTFLGGILLYQFAPKTGEESGITKTIEKWTSSPKDWEEMNAAHSLAAKQAGFDRNLFENETPKNRWVDVAYPEYVLQRSRGNRSAELTTPTGLCNPTANAIFVPDTSTTSMPL